MMTISTMTMIPTRMMDMGLRMEQKAHLEVTAAHMIEEMTRRVYLLDQSFQSWGGQMEVWYRG